VQLDLLSNIEAGFRQMNNAIVVISFAAYLQCLCKKLLGFYM